MMPPLVYFFCVFEYVLLHNNLFKLYFIDYAITVVLISPLRPSSTQYPSLPQAIYPHHCSRSWVMHVSSLATPFPILCFTSPWLFCNYLFVLLNPLTSSPIPLPIWQPSKCSLYPWFCLCSCLLSLFLRFNCWQICIFCYFIVHIFDLLK